MIISHYAQNVILSNMSHLVYITLFGETEGVTLSRLGCTDHSFVYLFILGANGKTLLQRKVTKETEPRSALAGLPTSPTTQNK